VNEAWGRITGVEPRLTRYAVGALGYSQTFDIRKARTQLGYAPPVSLAEGFDRFIHWQKSNHGTRS